VFIKEFQGGFEAGRICILSWYQDQKIRLSLGYIALGAENLTALKEDMQRIQDTTESVTY
jgi:hypothetical protein